jgi:hypothetical protein
MDAPVLFLVFNRPDVTKSVFEGIRQAQPKRLFVAADGPRENKPGEAGLCAKTRSIATQVDWPCEVTTLFRDENLGCRQAVSGAISWFFEHVEEGIILEDDCLPDASFFPYCENLLERYRDDTRIMCITGDNSLLPQPDLNESYSFTTFPLIWGWATWRRAWKHYDFDEFASSDHERVVRGISQDPRFVRKSVDNFQGTASGSIDSWGFVWSFCTLAQSGMTCVPRVNLIRNIGFGSGATHTTDDTHPRANLSTGTVQLPLSHPQHVCRDALVDGAALEAMYDAPPIPDVAYKMVRRWSRLKKKMGL